MTFDNNFSDNDFGGIKVVRAGSNRTATTVTDPAPTVVETAPSDFPAAPRRKSWLARFWWLPLLAVLAIAALAWGRNYYQSRYVGSDYWAQVPITMDTTPQELRDASGEPVGVYGTDYTVVAFNEAGEQRTLEFTARGEDVSAVPAPGSFLHLSASDQLVVNQRVVPESEVPAAVLNLIEAHAGS